MDELYHKDNIVIEFTNSMEPKLYPNLTTEFDLFVHLYKEEVVSPVIEHYNGLLTQKQAEKNYIMIYGQKGTGKTFMVKYILPKLLKDIDFEYIDMNYMVMLNSDLVKGIQYLSSFFLHTNETKKKKIYIIDHLDCALPNIDSNEMISASRKIKQNQVLMFFLDLIDSKNFNLLFVGRHYQNINNELAGVSRIDKHIQINAPDSKRRFKAFEHIINSSYSQRIGKFDCKDYQIDEGLTKDKVLSSI